MLSAVMLRCGGLARASTRVDVDLSTVSAVLTLQYDGTQSRLQHFKSSLCDWLQLL
jgi:hypothetical protein